MPPWMHGTTFLGLLLVAPRHRVKVQQAIANFEKQRDSNDIHLFARAKFRALYRLLYIYVPAVFFAHIPGAVLYVGEP